MKKHRIGISCIGSGVGQSAINSCRISRLPLYTVGLGTNPFAYGAYDCDAMAYTPTIYADRYVDELISTLQKYRIDLLIPGLDDEALILSKAIGRLQAEGFQVIVSDMPLIELCRDKERMSNELNPIVDVFVKSYDRQEALHAVSQGTLDFPLIAKPRGGFASRGIEIIRNEGDCDRIADMHIVQEMAIPSEDDPNFQQYMSLIQKRINPQLSEISIQLVTDPQGCLIGRMASYNKLNNGVPIEILPYDNEDIWEIIDALYPVFQKLGLRGPLNIQGRITEKGFKIFEMNPRFTGITGLRAAMGFNEVEACIKAWLNLKTPRTRLLINEGCFGMRQTADKVVPLNRNAEANDLSVKVNRRNLKPRPTILITGAGGYLGRHLTQSLLAQDRYQIKVVDLDKHQLSSLFDNNSVEEFDVADLWNGAFSLGQVECLVHCAFARPHCTCEQIASSLEFTSKLFEQIVANQVSAVINISSQSVYGLSRPPLWTEDLPVAPETPYAQAKYATELMARSAKCINNHFCFTSLRLSALSGGLDGFVPLDLLGKFAQKALVGAPIQIFGGSQMMERLDVRDAIGAILALLELDPVLWEGVYNVGPGVQYNICELAEMTVEAAVDFAGSLRSEVTVDPQERSKQFGMDISKIMAATGWSPEYSIEDTIRSVVKYMQRK